MTNSFLFVDTWSSFLDGIGWSLSQIILYVSFSMTNSDLCKHYLVVWSNFNLLHNFQRVTFPTHSSLLFYSFDASLLHLLIMWFIVSLLSLYNLHLFSKCVWSIFTRAQLVLLALFSDVIDSVSHLRFFFSFLVIHRSSLKQFPKFAARNIRAVVFLPIFIF